MFFISFWAVVFVVCHGRVQDGGQIHIPKLEIYKKEYQTLGPAVFAMLETLKTTHNISNKSATTQQETDRGDMKSQESHSHSHPPPAPISEPIRDPVCCAVRKISDREYKNSRIFHSGSRFA